MLTKITDDFYVDMDGLLVLSKDDDKYFFITKFTECALEISKEKYNALKEKLHNGYGYLD